MANKDNVRFSIKVKPNSKIKSVSKSTDGQIIVRINTPPIEGRANKAVIEALSDYYDIPKSKISIVVGLTSKNKIIEIK